MTTVAPLQLLNLFKSFISLLMVLLVLWSACGFLTMGDIIMPRDQLPRLLFLGLVLSLSAGLGWVLYKNYYHTILSYDENGFELQRGRSRIAGRWQDFSDVSLFHTGRGQFVVRLYKDKDQFEEIPVSDLKLDPSEFRFVAIKYVKS
jgi:hypothetical protein